MSRTKLVPEVFLDTFLYMRESRDVSSQVCRFAALLYREKKIKKNLCDQVVSNLTRD